MANQSKTRKTLILLTLIISGTFYSSRSFAMSVSYQGSLGLMGWTTPSLSQYVVNYSLTPRFAPAFEYFGLRSPQGNRELYFPQLGLLVNRWNELGSQANIYANVGYGIDHYRDQTSGALNLELQADWETRRYYLDAELQAVRLVRENPYNAVRLRAGFAPYLAEFDQLHSWFIVQFDRNSAIDSESEITPLVRLFYQNVLVEIGASLRGNMSFNFMVHI